MNSNQLQTQSKQHIVVGKATGQMPHLSYPRDLTTNLLATMHFISSSLTETVSSVSSFGGSLTNYYDCLAQKTVIFHHSLMLPIDFS